MSNILKTPTVPYSIKMSPLYVTPERAERWLSLVPTEDEDGSYRQFNRKLTVDRVNNLVKDMQAERFQFTHQAIALHPDGWPFDGQHRLSAIVESGLGQWLMIAEYDLKGFQESTMALDLGKSRTVVEMNQIGAGWGTPSIFAAARILTLFERGSSFTNLDIIEIATRERVHFEQLDLICKRKLTAPFQAAFCYVRPLDAKLFDEMLNKAFFGFQLSSDHDPLYHLHRMMTSEAAETWATFARSDTSSRKSQFRLALTAIFRSVDKQRTSSGSLKVSAVGVRRIADLRKNLKLSIPCQYELDWVHPAFSKKTEE